MVAYNIKVDFGAIGNGVADDAPAFVSAGTAMRDNPLSTLSVPAGTYNFGSNAQAWSAGVKGSVIGAGSGSTTLQLNGNCNRFGSDGQYHDGDHWGAVQSVSAGSSTATLITLSDYTKFSANQWVLFTGFNIQDIYSDVIPFGYGYPPNLTFFEYIQIQAIDSSTGVLTFYTPLQYSYLSTWPYLNSGSTPFEINAGGPAGIYSLHLDWDYDLTLQGFTMTANGAQLYGGGKNLTYNDCRFPGTSSPIPSQNQTFTLINCYNTVETEIDKLTTNVIVDSTDWFRFKCQSASITNMVIRNGSTMRGGLDGTGMNCTFTGSTLNAIKPGPYAYGTAHPGTITIDNCAVDTWNIGGVDLFAEVWATMSGGVMQFPKGTSVSNVADNGAGKTRFTVTSSSGLVVGKKIPTGNVTQELTATATTIIGNDTVTVGAGIPAWIIAGQALIDGVYFASGTTVLSKTATTIKFSTNAIATVSSGNKFAFINAALSSSGFPADGGGETILAIPDSTHVDFDIAFPSSFVYSYGAGLNQGGIPVGWAVPGQYFYWDSDNGSGAGGPARASKIIAVTEDAHNYYVQTNEAGGFPTVPYVGNRTITTVGATRIRASTLTGTSTANEGFMDARAYSKPPGTLFKKTITSSSVISPLMIGNLTYIVIDVITPYTGALPGCFLRFGQFDNLYFIKDGVSSPLGWGVDLKTIGRRIILPTNTVTNSTKKPNDTNLLVPTFFNSLWCCSTFVPSFYATAGSGAAPVNISGEAPGLWPSVNIEVFTDQGFPVDPTPPVEIVYGGRQNSKWQQGVNNLNIRPHFASDDIKKAAAVLSKMGGIARAKALTATQRSTIASTAAKARWK